MRLLSRQTPFPNILYSIISPYNWNRPWIVIGAFLAGISFFQQSNAGETSLAWDPVNDGRLGGYEIHYGRSPGVYDSSIDAGNTTAFTVAGLNAGTTYYYAVRAYTADRSVWSAFSNEVSNTVTSPDDGIAPTITTTFPADSTANVAVWTEVRATFSESMDPATVDATNFTLSDDTGNPVAAAITYDAAAKTAKLLPTSSLKAETTYSAKVLGGASGPLDLAGNGLIADHIWSFRTGAQSNTYSVWSDTDVPTNPSFNDSNAVELGVKFTSDVSGFIKGIRFYKGPGNTGPHTGSLWTNSGILLATETFVNETAEGWQQVNFSTPVPVNPDTVYVASYHAPNGNYAADLSYFAASGTYKPPLHLLQDGISGGNGVYSYSPSSTFPSDTYYATNYWVDVILVTELPTVAAFTADPTSGPVPLTVRFEDASTGAIGAWYWEFGDGGTSTEQSPTHVYTQEGTFAVKLTVTGPDGSASITKSSLITVTANAESLTPGLAAAYSFDESDGSLVFDASGNGNDGVISGATRVSGKFGNALSFDGVDDWVTVLDSVSLDLASGMTVEAWVYPTETMNGWQTAIMKEQTGGLAYALYANSDADMPVSSIHVVGDQNLYGGTGLEPSRWVHLATTYDGATQRLYIDGTEVARASIGGAILVSDGALHIGGNSSWPDEFFKGYIDEVRIYGRALTPTEIEADMATPIVPEINQAPVAGAGGPYAGKVDMPLTFDGTASSDADGTITSYTWDFGDGGSGIGPTPTHTYGTAGAYTATLTVVDNDGLTGAASATVTVDPNNLSPTADPGGPYAAIAGSALILDGTASVDPDGAIVTYEWDFGDGQTDTGSTPSHVYASAGTYILTLTVTDDQGLSSLPVETTVTITESPVGDLVAAFGFDEVDGVTVLDSSGKGNHGIIEGAQRTDPGRYGNALFFDGLDDWVTIAQAPSLNLTDGLTLEAWVYPAGAMGGWRSLLLKEQPDGLAYALYANSDLNIPAIALSIGGDQVLAGGTDLQINRWTHLASTYDGSIQRLYLNGVEVSSQPLSGSITISDGHLRIGGNSSWPDEFFQGYIDEVRIYSRALTPTEIRDDMMAPVEETNVPVMAQAEAGELTVDDQWRRIAYKRLFVDPVVVAKPLTANELDPGVVRIRNVDSTGFDILLQEWDYLDGNHGAEKAGYLVVERGTHVLPNGALLEANRLETAATYSFDPVLFAQAFTQTPIVLAAVTSFNEADAVTSRMRAVTPVGFEVGLREQELNPQVHAYETVSYVAWEPSTGVVDGLPYEAVGTQDMVTHDPYQISYQTLFDMPPVFLADMQTTDGGDTANLRRGTKTHTSIDIWIAEEQSYDDELWHTTERVGYFVFGVVDPLADTDGDGLSDTDEIELYGTDPIAADTDNDGINDGHEALSVWGALLWDTDIDADGSINLLDPDADGDGIADGIELEQGTDPGDPSSFPECGLRVTVGQAQVDHVWQPISFPTGFCDPIVIAKPMGANDLDPGVIRLRNVNSRGFDIRIQEWDYLDGIHGLETVSYLVIERGSYTLPDGTRIEADRLTSAATNAFDAVSFTQTFNETPVVIAAVTTFSEDDQNAVTTRVRNIKTSGFETGLREQELNVQVHASETICYVAWEPSSGSIQNLGFEVGRTPDAVTDIPYMIGFQTALLIEPTFLAHTQTTDGGDTMNLRWDHKSTTGIDVWVDEEQSSDVETSHTSEAVGYMVFTPAP